MKILFFAILRDRAGLAETDVEPPDSVADVAGLIEWLKGEGDGYSAALGDPAWVRVAVNQEHVPFDHPVAGTDEVAFFPPVTGGAEGAGP